MQNWIAESKGIFQIWAKGQWSEINANQTITGTGNGGERHTKSQKVLHYEMPELKLPQSKVSTKYIRYAVLNIPS